MRKIYYYYDAAVKSYDDRYCVDYYCTNGKKKIWAGQMYGDTPTAVLEFVRKLVEDLNRPKPLIGRICQWWLFKRRI